jgi:hypothetical protein
MGFLNQFIDFDPIVDSLWAKFSPMLEAQLVEWRKESMVVLREALPEIGGAIAREAIKQTFEHTQIDESMDAVTGVVNDIVGRLRLPPFFRLPG